jgi:signal transduction histidine kinase
MPVLNATGDAQRPPRSLMDDDALELVASELLYPLTIIRLNAEDLLQQFQQGGEDPTTADAAQALLHSVERMSQIVQKLMQSTRAPDQRSAQAAPFA